MGILHLILLAELSDGIRKFSLKEK